MDNVMASPQYTKTNWTIKEISEMVAKEMILKIINYMHLSHNDCYILANIILEHINEGWQPYGMIFKDDTHGKWWVQAMVKYE